VLAFALAMAAPASGQAAGAGAPEARKVRLEVRAPQAKDVRVVGPIAGGQAEGVAMRRGDDWRWWTVLELAPGRWGYAFSVDGKPVLDDDSDGTEPDGRGGERSYLLVRPDEGRPDPGVPHGAVEKRSLKSAILGEEQAFDVYLPPGFDRARRYPVLYLLHGMNMNEGQWVAGGVQNYLDNLIARKRIQPMVVIMPGVPGESLYVGDAERYVIEELVPHVAKSLPVDQGPGRAAVAGMSMGGFGAFYLAYKHPDVFGYADALSAGTTDGDFLNELNNELADGAPFKPQITIRCGKSDDGHIGFSQRLVSLLEHRHVKVTSEFGRGGHDWEYWHGVTPDVLEGASRFFGAKHAG
jgi:enterochelin esterase-like enzyme